jgi:hypothetical protein
MPKVRVPAGLQPEVYTFRDVMVILNSSQDYLLSEVKAGRLRSFKRGKFRLVSRAAINDYIKMLETEDQKAST